MRIPPRALATAAAQARYVGAWPAAGELSAAKRRLARIGIVAGAYASPGAGSCCRGELEESHRPAPGDGIAGRLALPGLAVRDPASPYLWIVTP